MITKRAVLLSIALHLLPLLLLIRFPSKGGPGDQANGSPEAQEANKGEKTAKIADKPKELIVELVEPEESPGEAVKPTPKQTECKNFYGGVGLSHDQRTGIIDQIGAGYPADRAGIKVGMIIINALDLRGEVGTKAEGQFIDLDGSIFSVVMIREKICYDDI